MAVAARSFWKGHLRLALVTIPVRLISASTLENTVQLHQVDRKTKQRIRYQKIASEAGDVVDSDDIVRGVEIEPGRYVLIGDDELETLKLETRHTIELKEFVDRSAIQLVYFERPYYVLPDGDVAEEGYRVIRDALRGARKFGVGQITMRGREHLAALAPVGDGLMLATLRYESEVRDAGEVFQGISQAKLRPELIEMAEQLIAQRTATFDAGRYRDHYADALHELVKAKVEGGGTVPVSGGEERGPAATVIDFMEALRKSVGGSAEASKPVRTKAKSAAARTRSDPVKRRSPHGKKQKSRS